MLLQSPPNLMNKGGSSTYKGATLPEHVPPTDAPCNPLPVPLPLEPLDSAEPRNEGEEQPLPADMEMLLLLVDQVPPNNLPLIPAIDMMDHGTKVTMRMSNCMRCPS